jgi:ABC-type lipoprotein export system ATPase subunit
MTNEIAEPGVQDYVIDAENVCRSFKIGQMEVNALRGVTLKIGSGTFVALMGRSGSGKTTLLNCLGGLDRPTSGSIKIFGNDLAKLKTTQLNEYRRQQVGFVFQSYGLLPTLSAYENVELMLRIIGMPSKERRDRTNYCLNLVGLTKWAHHRPYELSGGQQQRVSIARALANKPKLILADEPTGELDSATAREILSIFRQISVDEGVTLFIASHDNLITEFANTVLRLKDGVIEQTTIRTPELQ